MDRRASNPAAQNEEGFLAGRTPRTEERPSLFLERLRKRAERQPSKLALEFRSAEAKRRISYGALLESTGRAAAWLERQGVGPGDRVGLCLPKSLAGIQLHLAACGMGAVSMPLNPAYSRPELEYLLQDSEAKLLVTAHQPNGPEPQAQAGLRAPTRIMAIDPDRFDDDLPSEAGPFDAASVDSARTALILYTSGTTGRPKGACLSHGNLTANMDMLGHAWQWSSADILLHALPLFHVHGLLVALHGALHAGASVVVRQSFQAEEVLRDLLGGSCTVFMAVPTMYRRLLAAAGAGPASLRHLRLLTSGSDRLPAETFRQLDERFGVQVVERYGMTETGIMLSNPVDGDRRPGYVGLPLPNVEMRVVDPRTLAPASPGNVGELQTRGPHVFRGYWQDPGKTARSFTEDGWFRTGDLGRCGDDGWYELKGRDSDLIISGGFNVYPAEVEQALASHPGVDQCAVAGLPDDEWGEAVTGFVVRGDAAVTAEELIGHCRKSLTYYKLPKRVVFVESLPRNAMGKVRKAALRAAAAGELAPE